jgi:hypothetical protein
MRYMLTVVFGLIGMFFTVASFGIHAPVLGLIIFVVAWAPLAFVVWRDIDRAAKRDGLHTKLAQDLGVSLGAGFDHAEESSGVIIDTKGKRLGVHVDGVSKIYGYDQVRDVQIVKETAARTRVAGHDIANAAAAKRNSGLFINVRDIENPKWRIAMDNEATQQRWLEICNQEMREGGIA